MKFYRIENSCGCGPYHNDENESLMFFLRKSPSYNQDDYLKINPTPFNDSKKFFKNFSKNHNFIFGFNSPKKLIKWFSFSKDKKYNEENYFKKYGFKVSVYESTEIFTSKYQSIAQKDNLIFIKNFDFLEFKKNYKKLTIS
jgi:hypothetical protein